MARIDNLDHFLTDVASSIKTKKEMEAGATITPADFDTLIGSIDTLKGETKTITPTTSQQVITPSTGKNAITEVTVEAVTSAIDANITAGNIKSGTTILGVTGNYSGIDTSDANATASDILTGKSGYVNGVKINGNVADLKGSSHAVPFKKVDNSSGTISYSSNTISITPSNTLSGNAMVNSDTNYIVDVADTTMATAVSLTASKIAQGQTVLGVTGNYDGGVAAALAASY